MLDNPATIPSGRKNGTRSIARKLMASVALMVQIRVRPPR